MRICAVDIETFLPTPETPIGAPISLQWFSATEQGVTKDFNEMNRLLREYDILIGHNFSFDLGVLTSYGYLDKEETFTRILNGGHACTMIMAQLLDLSSAGMILPNSLADCVLEYLGEHVDKSLQKKFSDVAALPIEEWPQEYINYAISDVRQTYRLYQSLLKKRRDHGAGSMNTRERRLGAAYWLFFMERRGFNVSSTGVGALQQASKPQYEQAADILIKEGYAERHKKTGKLAIKKGLIRSYVGIKYPAYSGRTEKGGISLSAENIIELATDPLIQQYLDLMDVEKVITTYLPPLEDAIARGGKCYTRFNALKVTGRVSSSGPGKKKTERYVPSMAVQQFPKTPGVRECIVSAQPQTNFIHAFDYSNLELFSVAQLMLELYGDSEMANQLNAGRDLHSYLGSILAKVPYDVFEAGRKDSTTGFKAIRQMAKPINLSYPGLVSPPKMSIMAKSDYTVDMTIDQAIELKLLWFKTFPEMVKFYGRYELCQRCAPLSYEDCQQYPCTQCGYLNRHTGIWLNTKLVRVQEGDFYRLFKKPHSRQFHYSIDGRYRNNCNATHAANGVAMQSRSGEGAVIAGIRLERYATYKPILFVHDEFVFDMPNEKSYKEEVSNIMIQGMKVMMPDMKIRVEGKVMTNYTTVDENYLEVKMYG